MKKIRAPCWVCRLLRSATGPVKHIALVASCRIEVAPPTDCLRPSVRSGRRRFLALGASIPDLRSLHERPHALLTVFCHRRRLQHGDRASPPGVVDTRSATLEYICPVPIRGCIRARHDRRLMLTILDLCRSGADAS